MALNGIDISSHQYGINLSAVPADFVIIKVTEGVSYISSDWKRQYYQAKSSGKLIGLYHYAAGNNVIAESRYFLSQISDLLGKGDLILALDWEVADNPLFGSASERAWVSQWLNYVTQKTGVKPMLYCQASIRTRLADIGDYGLWIAQYANYTPTGYQTTPWNEGAYTCAIRQYSSCGTLAGYGGRLDLDKFYGNVSTWYAYCGTKNVPQPKHEGVKVSEKDGVYRLYNPNSGEHFFTKNANGVYDLTALGWKYEGVAWHEAGDTDVYRLYSGNEHMYVTTIKEMADLWLAGWKLEKAAFKCWTAAGEGRVPVYRLYNRNGGKHMYTTDVKERDDLIKAGWKLEGVAFYEHK